jgi:hypothetical protein
MVALTAACFFTGGVALGAGVISAINRPVNSTPDAAQSMQSKLQQIQNLPPGEQFQVTFTEAELSSYFRFVAAPQVGITDGKVRLLPDSSLVVAGDVEQLGGRTAAATFELQDDPEKPLQMTGAALQVIDAGESSFGWIGVPTSTLGNLEEQVNNLVSAGAFRVEDVQVIEDALPEEPGDQPAWHVNGITTGFTINE